MKWTKDGEFRPGENGSNLKIINATPSDTGSYKCSKENSSHVIQVIVDGMLNIVYKLKVRITTMFLAFCAARVS